MRAWEHEPRSAPVIAANSWPAGSLGESSRSAAMLLCGSRHHQWSDGSATACAIELDWLDAFPRACAIDTHDVP